MRIVGVTNRSLCSGGEAGFLAQIERIAASGVDGLILREKDLLPKEYEGLARKALEICKSANVEFIPHTFIETAVKLGVKSIHLPWGIFKSADTVRLSGTGGELPLLHCKRPEEGAGVAFGVSVHSPVEAAEAEQAGAAWLIAGHVFTTDCKKGLEPRGLEFITSVCKAVKIPVYAIGGISEFNIAAVEKAGAGGACIMSSLMESPEPMALIAGLRARLGAA